jgi:DNA-directed RNA polymerase subunit RPC12/RpoP
MNAPASITAQIQDNYKCARCGAERSWPRSGKVAPKRPLIYCAKCGCIRLHSLTTDITDITGNKPNPVPSVPSVVPSPK